MRRARRVTLTVSATGAGFTLSTAKTLTIASGQTASTGVVTVTAVADTTALTGQVGDGFGHGVGGGASCRTRRARR